MVKPVRVVPAILTDSPQELDKLLRQAETFTDFVQLDVMDGKFVPSQSVNAEHIAALHTNLNWEVHLMVLNPENQLESFKKAGAQKAVFHYEATHTPKEVISRARDIGIAVGLAVNPETKLSSILPLADEVDSVLFLSVTPGFYGSKYIPEVIDKVAAFHKARPKIEIGVDGGVKESNIVDIARAGASVIYVGSAISLQPDPAESYRRLLKMAQQS